MADTTKDEQPKVESVAKQAKQAEAADAAVQEQVDHEQDQGFRGDKTDPTDNSAYTVQGVTSGAPTPETDPDAAAAAGSTRFNGTKSA